MASANPKSFLITGATGNQGGAVIEALLAEDEQYEIQGLTRNKEGDAATALSDRGVKMVEGNLDEKSTLVPLLQEVDAVFGITNFWRTGYETQVQQGKNLVDAAAEAGVDHFVFSGVGDHDQDTGIPHFDSSWEIDQHLQESGVPNTVLKPVFFLQNFEPMSEDILGGTLAFPLAEGVSLQMVDVKDLGKVAAQTLTQADRFAGERYDIAGEEKTLEEMAEIFSKVTGVEIEAYHVSIADARKQAGDEWADMCQWFNEVGYSADIEGLEETFGTSLTTSEEYLKREEWALGHTPAAVPGWIKGMQEAEG